MLGGGLQPPGLYAYSDNTPSDCQNLYDFLDDVQLECTDEF